MGRKRNPVLPIFTRDILSSPRCRALSASAAGIYFFLLCRLNEPPQPGAYRLSDWEQHPNWRRSKTQQCLATADKYERLQYFAALLAKNDLPWRQKDILSGLQELYRYGIITVEGDILVQPRMYKDNGFILPDFDNDGAQKNTILDDNASGTMASEDGLELSENKGAKSGTQKRTKKGTEKVQRKVSVSHAGAGLKRDRDREYNIDNNKGNIGGVGDFCAGRENAQIAPAGNDGAQKERFNGEKNEKGITVPPKAQKRADGPEKGFCGNSNSSMAIDGHSIAGEEDDGPLFSEFWEAYDKKVSEIDAKLLWNVLSVKDREAILAYIPKYKIAQPQKRFRKNPVSFLRMRAWEDEIIPEQESVNINGYEGSKRNIGNRGTATNRNQGDDEQKLIDQSVRIMQRLQSEGERPDSDNKEW